MGIAWIRHRGGRDFSCVCVLFTQSCPTLCDPMDCSPPGSSVQGVLQARILEWVAIPFSRDLPDSGIEPGSPALAGGFFTTEPPGKPTVDSCCALISVKTSSLHYSSFSGSQNSLTYFAIRTLGSACFF